MPPPAQSSLAAAASFIVTGCAVVLLAAVARNFAVAPRAGPTTTVQRSPVATASMIGFFVLLYAVIHQRWGLVVIASPGLAVGLTVVGLVCVVAGTAINLAGRRELGRNWSNQPAIYATQTLVTTGVFRAVRHPLYGSLVLVGAGASLAFHNGLGLLLTVAVFVPAMHWRASQEERLLAARFAEYAAYKSRTGRLLPRLRQPLPLPQRWRGGGA